MFKFIIKRLLLMIPVLLGVTFVLFTLMYITPGGVVGRGSSFIEQFFQYIYQVVVHQNMGTSLFSNRPVLDDIMDRLPATIRLATAGISVSLILGIPTGIISATKQYSLFDNLAMFVTLLGFSMPLFWLGLILIIVFGLHLGWAPITGGTVLPAISIGVGIAAVTARMTRSTMLEVVRQDYIRTARAKGLSERAITLKHILKNALIPVVTIVGLQFATLLGGVLIAEHIFSIQGVGFLVQSAISRRDHPIILGGGLFLATAFSFVNLLVDILYVVIDPRVKSQYK